MVKKLIILLFAIALYTAFSANAGYDLDWYATEEIVLFDDGSGFESPWSPTTNAGNWDSFNNTPVSESSIVKKGSISMEISAASTYMSVDISDSSEVWIDFWVYATTSTAFHSILDLQDGSANYIDIVIDNSPTVEVQVTDSSTTWESTDTISTTTWTHIFVHLKFNGAGASTVQIGQSTTDYWDAWDFDSSTETLVPSNVTNINCHGFCNAQASDTFYFDGGLKVIDSSSMPAHWSA